MGFVFGAAFYFTHIEWASLFLGPLPMSALSVLQSLFVALGGTAAAAVIITDNSQVAPDTISGHRPPVGKHANVIAGSIGGLDVAEDSLGRRVIAPGNNLFDASIAGLASGFVVAWDTVNCDVRGCPGLGRKPANPLVGECDVEKRSE